MHHIVLIEPLIPQNAGTTARLSAATNSMLHFVEPLGFELSDRYLKRAGLDYWPEVKLQVHKNWLAFLQNSGTSAHDFWFFTKFADRPYYDAEFSDNSVLVFGNEEKGLDPSFHDEYRDRRLSLPMDNPRIRSLNLSNSVAIALYEARRQAARRQVNKS